MSKNFSSPYLFKIFPFLRWWPMVSRDTNKADLIAAISGAMIVLPQGVAFATIAGMPPEYGLYAAMVPAIIAALFGSSWHLVSGPTTAISIAVFAAMGPLADPGSPQFISMVLTLTFLTGLFQLILGLARMGVLVNFISHTVVIGFTAGAALLIIASQVKNFFGIDIARGAHFHEVIEQLILQFNHINPYVAFVAGITLVVCCTLFGTYANSWNGIVGAQISARLLMSNRPINRAPTHRVWVYKSWDMPSQSQATKMFHISLVKNATLH